MEQPVAGTASSPTWVPSHLWSGHMSRHPEPPVHRQARGGGGMKGHAPSTACAIYVTAGAKIRNGAALAPRGRDLNHSRAICMMCASLGFSVHPTTSSSMMARPILASSWWTTASCAWQEGWTMTSSSSSSSPSTWPTCPELGSITCPETRSIVGRISRRSSPVTFMERTCDPTFLGI
jgi:hypothetical protein